MRCRDLRRLQLYCIEKEACVAELNRLREMDKERSQKHDQKMKGR